MDFSKQGSWSGKRLRAVCRLLRKLQWPLWIWAAHAVTSMNYAMQKDGLSCDFKVRIGGGLWLLPPHNQLKGRRRHAGADSQAWCIEPELALLPANCEWRSTALSIMRKNSQHTLKARAVEKTLVNYYRYYRQLCKTKVCCCQQDWHQSFKMPLVYLGLLEIDSLDALKGESSYTDWATVEGLVWGFFFDLSESVFDHETDMKGRGLGKSRQEMICQNCASKRFKQEICCRH